MADHVPLNAFNYEISFPEGGFSDVSGLGLEITTSEYREGDDKGNYVRKIPGIHKGTDVTLKRGVVDSSDLWEWLDQVRSGDASAKKDTITIKLLNDAREAKQEWTLRGVLPTKYTGPTLAAKGGGDVAMEELTLSVDSFEIGGS